MRGIPCDMSKEEWGPLLEEMKKTYRYEFEKQVIQKSDFDSEEEEECIEWDDENSLEDAEFLDNLEMTALVDEFRNHL